MTHKYSVETLYHFSCGSCKSWWSIGDFNITRFKSLTCPYCGETEALEDINEEEIHPDIIEIFNRLEELL